MVKWIQFSAASLAISTMVTAPIVEAAASKKKYEENVSMYLKQTGLSSNKKMTVGEFWKMVRHVYPKDMQGKMDLWVKAHAKDPMPKVMASTYKDGDNNTYVRMILAVGKESHTLTLSENEARALSLNNVVFTEKELLQRKGVLEKADRELGKKKSSKLDKRVLSTREIARLPLKKQIEYFLKLREAAAAAEAVLAKTGKRTTAELDLEGSSRLFAGEFSGLLKTLLGEEAFAASWSDGSSCIAAGFVATYKNGSCARPSEGRNSLRSSIDALPFDERVKSQANSCVSSGGLPCNPILFGFSSGSSVHCVSRSNVKYATKECNEMFPLNTKADREKIIQSIVTAKGGRSLCKIEDDGRTVPSNCLADLGSYVTDLKAHYKNAAEFCTVGGDASTISAASWRTRSDLKADQSSACDNLKDRYFDLVVKEGDIPPPVAGEGELPGPSEENCAKENKNFDPEKEICVCPAGQTDPKDPNKCLATSDDDLAGGGIQSTEELFKKGPNWWDRNKNWAIPVGVGLVGLGLFWWLTKKDDDDDDINNNYIPPATTLPTTPICDSGMVLVNGVCQSPVVTPPAADCPSPNTMVGGVCVPPVVTAPPEVPSSEGGSGTSSDSAGGVR